VSGAIQVDGGYAFSLALKADGTVWAWGYGLNTGNPTATITSPPVQTSGLSGVSQIAAGTYFSLALKSDGTVFAWGEDTSGQLGTNRCPNHSPIAGCLVPIPVHGLTGVTRVAAGYAHGLALSDNDLTLVGLPANITAAGTSPSGAAVAYQPPTSGDEDIPARASVSCRPTSGTTFRIGTTTVTCTATDPDDSDSPVSESFTVTVTSVPPSTTPSAPVAPITKTTLRVTG
jgi:hypothetical protein